jgi:hypothetical protein
MTTMRPCVRLSLALVLTSTFYGSAASEALKLDSPIDYQVFQRQSRFGGVIRIAGKLDNADGVLQFRIVGQPLEGSLPGDWKSLPFDPQTRTFCVDAAAPAGGWYRLQLRSVKNGVALEQTTVAHVGLGEVFVVAGQSNSANHGEGRQRPATDRVVTADNPTWGVANDPQPGASGDGGSFIPAFGDAMEKKYRVPIGLVCLGVGGTSVREWLPKGDAIAAPPTTGANMVTVTPNSWACSGVLFDRLADTVRRLGPNGFRAVLWHQGESDAHQPAGHNITPEQYREYLARLIHATREAAAWCVPWFVAQASYHTPADTGTPELRAAQKSLAVKGLTLEGPNTDELGGAFRENNGQGVHFNAKGLRRHGQLWAEKVGTWLDRRLAQADQPPRTSLD